MTQQATDGKLPPAGSILKMRPELVQFFFFFFIFEYMIYMRLLGAV